MDSTASQSHVKVTSVTLINCHKSMEVGTAVRSVAHARLAARVLATSVGVQGRA
jgi:hypothetical protein